MTSYAPPGWPRAVRPPDAPDWEVTASSWLLDICPPEYRSYPVLRRHVVVLARLATQQVKGQQESVDRALSEARGALVDVAEGDVVERYVETLQREAARLLGLRRETALVEEALRGRRFVARL
ncbi:hypothetical protein GCM10027425_19380 [Alteromonas gracilis]